MEIQKSVFHQFFFLLLHFSWMVKGGAKESAQTSAKRIQIEDSIMFCIIDNGHTQPFTQDKKMEA